MTDKLFKPYDRVIVRLTNGKWKADLYSHYDEQHAVHRLVSGERETKDILPYEGNEHLICKDWETIGNSVSLASGTQIIYANSAEELLKGYGLLGSFDRVAEEVVWISIHPGNSFPFRSIVLVPLSKYNPLDNEETEAEILTAKGGKLIKLK